MVVFLNSLLFVSFNSLANSNCYLDQCAVSQQSYQQILNRFSSLFPRVHFNYSWSNSRPEAYASGNSVTVSGGFARKPGVSNGGMITVICHEIGHAKYGYSEGEADHYAMKECMDIFYRQDNNEMVVRQFVNVPEAYTQYCSGFQDNNSRALCVRKIIAGFNAAELGRNRCLKRMREFQSQVSRMSSGRTIFVEEYYFRCLRMDAQLQNHRLRKADLQSSLNRSIQLLASPLSFTHRDQRQVRYTYREHNSPQCRLDTFVTGIFYQRPPRCWST